MPTRKQAKGPTRTQPSASEQGETTDLVYEKQKNAQCGIHSLNHIVAHTAHPEFKIARHATTIEPMTPTLAKSVAAIRKKCAGDPEDDGTLPTFEAVMISLDMWNLVNNTMPRLRATAPVPFDDAGNAVVCASDFGAYIGGMLSERSVLGAIVIGVTLSRMEHYIAVVRVDGGFSVIDSIAKPDGRASEPLNGLRVSDRHHARFPFTPDASKVHDLVLRAFPPVTGRKKPIDYQKPSYSLVFTDASGSGLDSWYKSEAYPVEGEKCVEGFREYYTNNMQQKMSPVEFDAFLSDLKRTTQREASSMTSDPTSADRDTSVMEVLVLDPMTNESHPSSSLSTDYASAAAAPENEEVVFIYDSDEERLFAASKLKENERDEDDDGIEYAGRSQNFGSIVLRATRG
jgi:hypothetical protein